MAILSTMPLRTSCLSSLACSWLGGGISGLIDKFFSGKTKLTFEFLINNISLRCHNEKILIQKIKNKYSLGSIKLF